MPGRANLACRSEALRDETVAVPQPVRPTSSEAGVTAEVFAGGSDVMQAMAQTNPANSRGIAVTTTCLGLERQDAERATDLLFLLGATIMALVALYGLWKPASVFDSLEAERPYNAELVDDIKRLLRHWPIYPALLISFLWNFAPGAGTPLQYYLQNTLHAQDAQWGQWNAIFTASFIPTFLVFGVLCRKFPLRPLLFWGTVVAIPQFIPLLFVHSVTGALIAAAPIGLMGGVATAAYLDLMIRSCPRGLQGTLLMMSLALYAIVTGLGNLLGTNLYEHFGGFTVCVIAITVVYALILPVLLLVPKRLIETADGRAPEVAFTTD
jgi:hypothetical protein